MTLAPFFVPRLMSDLNENHPELQVRFIEGTLDRLQQLLKSGGIEVALLYALDLDSEFRSEDLTVIEPHVLLPPHHSLAGGNSVSLKALQDESMILLDLPHSREYFQQLFQHLGITPRIEQRTASFELVRGLVARGHGYSVLNLQPASELTYDGSRVRCLPIREQAMPLRVVLVRLSKTRQTRRAEAFAQTCRDFFRRV